MAGKKPSGDATNPTTPDSEEGNLTGLLGGKLDLFGFVGLGLGASQRARELVLKGLLFELDEKLKQLKPKRGRPHKPGLTIDEERALAVLGADALYRDRTGSGAPSIRAAIETAAEIDSILVSSGVREKALFGHMTTFLRLQNSVSAGLKSFPSEASRLSNK